jgi:cytochrome c biogenesis protein CcdA
MIFAFTAGLLSTVNPCGFAMLPAYLSFFMGLDEEDAPRRVVVGRALKIGLIMSAGFVAVFTVIGGAIQLGGEAFRGPLASSLSWIALVTGGGVVLLGVWMLLGNTLKVRVPNFRTHSKSQGSGKIFAFGVSYALASLSCALPIFFGVITISFDGGFLAGIRNFVAYGVGMAGVVLVLTLAMALGKDAIVHRLRQASRVFNKVSGAILVLAGTFVVFYWSLLLVNGDDALSDNALTVWVEGLQSDLTEQFFKVPKLLWIPILGIPIAGALFYALRGDSNGNGRPPTSQRKLEETTA